VSILTVLMF